MSDMTGRQSRPIQNMCGCFRWTITTGCREKKHRWRKERFCFIPTGKISVIQIFFLKACLFMSKENSPIWRSTGRKRKPWQTDEAFLQIPTQRDHRNSIEYAGEMRALDGGLLFIGVFFGLLFSVCVVLIMYYKQISEGFEDQDSFHIMKKVGMSDEDVRSTIRRQILLVFGLPVAAAILHTVCSMNMTVHLLYTLNLFDTAQIYRIGVGVTAVFLGFYGVSYLITARTYYKIVR